MLEKTLTVMIGALVIAFMPAAIFAGGQAQEGDNGTELSVSHYFVEADTSAQGEATRQMIERFQEENPDVNLTVDTIGHDSYEERLPVLAAGNELPDVFRYRGAWLEDLIDDGQILSMNELLDESEEFAENRLDNSFGPFEVDGEVYGVPMNALSTSLVYYNEDMFEDAGIDSFPETWSDFEDAIVALSEAGYIPLAMGNQAPWLGQSSYLSTIATRFTGQDWFFDLYNREGASFADEEFVEALEHFQRLPELDAFNEDFVSIDNEAQRRLYYNERAAMFIEGSWALEQLEDDAPENVREATNITVIPAFEDATAPQNTMSGGPSAWAWGIRGDLTGERLEKAWELVTTINGTESANIMAEGGGIPLTSPTDYDESGLSPRQLQFLQMFEDITITPIYDAYLDASLIETINNGIQELLLEEVTPQELAERFENAYQN